MTKTSKTTLRLVYTTNNARDSILLVRGDLVVSRWDAIPETIQEYLSPGDLSDWEIQDIHGLEDGRCVEDWGDDITDDSRRMSERLSHHGITAPTTAQQIAAQLGNNGQTWETDEGRSWDDLCIAAGGDRYTETGVGTRYEFPDGSVLTACGGAWDYGHHSYTPPITPATRSSAAIQDIHGLEDGRCVED